MQNSENIKISSRHTIAQNTGVLYLRTLFLLLINLYTSRVILNTLGVIDYGIYIAVAGVISMLSLISSPLANAISRFITFEIGKSNEQNIKSVITTSRAIILMFIIVVALLLESVGLWFLNNIMTIPNVRLETVQIVYQIAVLCFIFSILQISYNSIIIAYERMTAYAYIGIIDAILKLVIAISLYNVEQDKLLLYVSLLLCESILIWLIYMIYVKRNFATIFSLSIHINRKIFSQMFGYAGWNLFGGAASTCQIHGTNILLNVFGGPIVNAAQGIANQVSNAVLSFMGNFTTAINPSIIKSYASQNFDYMNSLVIQGAKYSFFMLWLIVLPLELETEIILSLWLGEIPNHAVLFVRLVIIYPLIESLSKTVMTAINATGNVMLYQLSVGSLLLLNIPISYLLLKNDFPVETTAIVAAVLGIFALWTRLLICQKLTNIKLYKFSKDVIYKVLIVCLVSSLAPLIVVHYMDSCFLRLFIILILSFISISLSVLYIGCSLNEKNKILGLIKKTIIKYVKI